MTTCSGRVDVKATDGFELHAAEVAQVEQAHDGLAAAATGKELKSTALRLPIEGKPGEEEEVEFYTEVRIRSFPPKYEAK